MFINLTVYHHKQVINLHNVDYSPIILFLIQTLWHTYYKHYSLHAHVRAHTHHTHNFLIVEGGQMKESPVFPSSAVRCRQHTKLETIAQNGPNSKVETVST